jgi:hypothetical protein
MLRADVDTLRTRLEVLEKSVGTASRSSSCSFPECCALLLRSGKISPASVLPAPRDPIGTAIVELLFARGPLSVSEISRSLRTETGAGDRKTVRVRLRRLERDGTAQQEPETLVWRLTNKVVEAWQAYVARIATSGRVATRPARGCGAPCKLLAGVDSLAVGVGPQSAE